MNIRELDKLLRDNPDIHVVGGTARNDPPAQRGSPEHNMQVEIIRHCNRRAESDPQWRRVFAVPNGGQRNRATAGRLKAEGVRAGVPDLMWPIRRHGFVALAMELKAGRNTPTVEQNQWLTFLANNGWYAAVCLDAPSAIAVLDWYYGEIQP